jgi:hypothetical protein
VELQIKLSLFSVLAFEGLSTEYTRTSTIDACKLIAVQFENLIKTFHLKTYFINSFLQFFPGSVLPINILENLSELSTKDGVPIPLNTKYKKLSEKLEWKTEDKLLELQVANFGDKVIYYKI